MAARRCAAAPRRSCGDQPPAGGRAAEAAPADRPGGEWPGGDVPRRRHLHRRHGDGRCDRDRDRPRDRQRPSVVTGRDDAAVPSRVGRSIGRRLPDDRPGERIGPQTAHAGADDRTHSLEGVIDVGAQAQLRAVARQTQRRLHLHYRRDPGTLRRRRGWTLDDPPRHRRHPDELRLRSDRSGHPVRGRPGVRWVVRGPVPHRCRRDEPPHPG